MRLQSSMLIWLMIMASQPLQAGSLLYFVNTTSDIVVPGACQSGLANCSLRGAVEAANSHPGDDGIEIDLPVGSVINLTGALPTITDSVSISGPGPDKLTVRRDTGGDYGIFDVTAAAASFSGLTISNGFAYKGRGGGIKTSSTGTVSVNNSTISGNSSDGTGGGISNASGTLNVTNSTISDNHGTGGGGIFNQSGTLNVTNTTISGNSSAGNEGGGISNLSGILNVTNSVITYNHAYQGGGITNGGPANISKSTISYNTAASIGGGIKNRHELIVIDSTISNNAGGGIDSLGNVTVNVTNSTISGHQGSSYGISANGFLNVANSTISDNYAGIDFIDVGDAIINHCTISGNTWTGIGSGAGAIRVKNSIIALNGASDVLSDSVTSEGFNLIGKDDLNQFTQPTDLRGTSASPLDPNLDPNGLRDNGGPTKTIALLSGPAVDKGVSDGLTTDQRGLGFLRKVDDPLIPNAPGGDGADIGAFETADSSQSGYDLTVTTLQDHDDGTCSVADCTLREAINAANTIAGDNTINFAPGVVGTILLETSLPILSTNMAIQGPGANLLDVQRDTAASVFRIFYVQTSNVTFNGLTISFGSGTGGGIFNDHGNVTVNGCLLYGNGNMSAGSAGGGLYNFGYFGSATMTVLNSTLYLNTAVNGGGVNNSAGTLTMTNCTLSENSATTGGAIMNDSLDAGDVATLTMRNCTLFANRATTVGGIYNYGASGSPAVANVGSTIFYRGQSGNNIGNSVGSFTSQGYNLSNQNDTAFLNQASDLNSIDPHLDILMNNGGPTQTHALLANSPAINAGNDALAPARDQRYYARNGVADIGAFEYHGPLTPLSAVSRKNHNGTDLDLNLPLTGPTVGVECRRNTSSDSSGPNAGHDHQVIVTFPFPVAIDSASGDHSVTADALPSGSNQVYTINLHNVPNAQLITLSLNNVHDSANSFTDTIPMGILVGDVNATGGVDGNDVAAVQSHTRQPVNSDAKARFDVNVTGNIDGNDVAVTQAQTRTRLP